MFQLLQRFPNLPFDFPAFLMTRTSTLSATFLFPNGNEERLNVGAEEYVLPPWFDKEPFSALSEPFERKRFPNLPFDLPAFLMTRTSTLSATFLFPNGNEERLNVGAEEYVLPPWFDKEPFGTSSKPFKRKRLDLIR
ncbi:hypothetical protein CDAR_118301 [Caerostris darwini]|uniref:Uncharacterized protein n=1 Tax=Caerostris darwini TaxID=1538125 RepID=A0AAV4RVR6_9ARAC|nr:hypothetical protein CDAR_118301 [Caerostris darwini]